ncbi:MAG: TAXI family TRAP transporter solute-binding subunit [Bacillota bacterium]
MKKGLALLLIITLVLSMALVGCGGKQEAPKEEPKAEPKEEPAKVEKLQINIITGSTGGTYFPLGGAMANVWSKYIDNLQVTSQPGGASVESINRVNAGEVELGMAMNNIADDAWNGLGKWEGKAIQNFRAIGVIYPEVYQGVAIKESGIKTLEDLKGKRVAVGPVGSGTAVLSEAVLSEAGLDIKKDIKAEFAGFGDAASKMKDGHLDANFGVLSVPAAAIQDIKTVRDIEIIEIKGELFEKIKANYPFFSQFVIPAGTYGNTEDKYTINCQAALYVTPDLPEDVVYNITKVFYEKADEIAQAHAAGKYINLEKALDGITTKLHPGAVKYYEEKGIKVPDNLK